VKHEAGLIHVKRYSFEILLVSSTDLISKPFFVWLSNLVIRK